MRISCTHIASSLALFTAPFVTRAQSSIPIRQLGPVEARSNDTVGFLRGVREISGGRLLVNDSDNRRLLLFEPTFASFKIIADTAGKGTPYGARATTIIPFRGDSTLFVDVYSRGFAVVAPNGSTARTIAAPRTEDIAWLANSSFGQPAMDPAGRVVYRAYPRYVERDETQSLAERPDSAPIVRANFETRTADTLALIAIPARRMSSTKLADGRTLSQLMVNPLTFADDWAALPDGSVAILRGRDYHIDWINADGTRSSSPKMPFDWKRLTDAEKQTILDSAQKAVAQRFAEQNAPAAPGAPPRAPAAGGSAMVGGGGDSTAAGGAPRPAPPRVMPQVVPMSDLPDYVPPVYNTGTMRADPMGNLWILPSTSSQSTGGLLYDVINRKGEIFERVRIPAGRALAGFGANGAVYLTAHDSTGNRIERTRVKE